VERPFRYIREDFSLARRLRILADLNEQLRHCLNAGATPWAHATTRRVAKDVFANERLDLRPSPLEPLRGGAAARASDLLRRHGRRRGCLYNVPNATRRPIVEVHALAEEIRIFEDGAVIAGRPVLEGHHQRLIAPSPRSPSPRNSQRAVEIITVLVSRNSWTASIPLSRPNPDRFIPPKGSM